MRRLFALSIGLFLLGCSTHPDLPETWVRTDGQGIFNNPALNHQFTTDKTICEGEVQKANLSGTQLCRGATDCLIASMARDSSLSTVAKGCMAQKGYALVRTDMAEEYMSSARAASVQNKRAAAR